MALAIGGGHFGFRLYRQLGLRRLHLSDFGFRGGGFCLSQGGGHLCSVLHPRPL
jgi:hypothetical protein